MIVIGILPLTEKINLFIALAPATKVKQLNNPMVAAISTSRPDLIFLMFGKKSLLSEALFWRRVLSTGGFILLIDTCLKLLFGWTCAEIDHAEKGLLYAHIYSFSSVKCLVHWFQITRTKRFQMFDGHISPRDSLSYPSYLLPSYQLSKIKCPIAVFHGGKDTIPESELILKELPHNTYVHKEDNYEHLDFIWAVSAPERVFKKCIELVDKAH